jgi:hypothetical protein
MKIGEFVRTAKLEPQSYGIAMAQCTFGGPTGIWLECRTCRRSDKIKGTGSKALADRLTDEHVSKIFRRHGWQGDTDRMLNAKCPDCAKGTQNE